MSEKMPTVKFLTLGCKVNQYESEAMLEQLFGEGFLPAGEGEPADVVVLNSCTVTAASDQKARQALRRLKRENPGAAAVLCGCWPQAFPEEAAAFTEADVVLGTRNRSDLPRYVREFLARRERIVDVAPHGREEGFEPLRVSGMRGRTRAFLKIEDGCNRFCSYCVIPYARGRVRSKALAALRAEAEKLASRGYREIVLTGINLSAYGQELGLELCDAVEAVCAVDGVARVRLGSLEPERLGPETIGRLRRQEKVCPQFHLSLQSGCDATLRRMNRHYTAAEYRQIAENLRAAFPSCALTTDVMVGFAGETEEEFDESCRFVEAMGFARVHVFAYSRRPGTAAYNAPDQVPAGVKEGRSRRMIALAGESRQAFFRAQTGRVEEVLFEQPAADGLWEGYTRNYTPVRVRSGRPLQGELLPVLLTEAREACCLGEIHKIN